MDFIKQLINGLQIGSIYALVSLGYTMVYGIVKLINFAHGDIIMVGAYVAFMCVSALTSMGLPVYLAVVPAIAFCSLLGVVIEKVAYKPMRNSARISSLITAIGVSLLLQNAFMLIFSPNPRPFDTVFSGKPIEIGELSINISTIITITVSVVLMIILQLFITKSKAGKAMVAVSEDFSAAQLVGINVDNTISMTFAIGSGLAAVASILYVSAYPQITPTMGSMLGLKAFVAAVLGGIGIIPGAMIGGFIIGIVEALTKAYISTELADALEMSEEKVMEIMQIAREPASLETPIGEEEDSHLGDFIPDDDAQAPSEAAAYSLLREQIEQVLCTLTDRERRVLKLRFGLDDGRPRTLEEVGKEFDVTRERIRQIEAKALRKLRGPKKSNKLKDYLD